MSTRGRPLKYLTREEFEQFRSNDFFHLQYDVRFNRKLLWVILAALIAAALFDHIFI